MTETAAGMLIASIILINEKILEYSSKHFFDKKYAGSYHTMILLGVDEEGQIVFTDSATRDWAGEQQRLKRAKLSELISYMFPQKNVGDTHLYFSRKRNTGGYILIC